MYTVYIYIYIYMYIYIHMYVHTSSLLVSTVDGPHGSPLSEGNGHLHFNDIWGVKLIGQGAERRPSH